MGTTTARRRAPALLLALALALGLVAGLLITVATTAPAAAATGTGTGTGKVVGEVRGTQPGRIRAEVLWFDQDWRYLGRRKVSGDIYSLALPPGRYHLQFVDLRPAYDVTKYAPADVTVTVRRGRTVQRSVTLRRGAAITGTVRAGGRPAARARLVAANTHEQSYEVKADGRGRFAVGGLPTGSYSLFAYDPGETWVGRSLWVPGLERGRVVNVAPRLDRRGGSLLVQLRRPGGQRMTGSFSVTAVSKATGQFWTARARRGEVSFPNLAPGGYRMVAPGVGNYFAHTAPIQGARVKAGRADLVSTFRWTQRGAWITGTVVDEADHDTPLAGADVVLVDQAGARLDQTVTDEGGRFTLDGQIGTQDGLEIRVSPSGGGWMAGAQWCEFEATVAGPFSVRVDEQLPIDEPIALPHAPATTPQCAV